jgi:cytochrome c5
MRLSVAALSTIVIGLAACNPTQRSNAVAGAELNGKPVDQAAAQLGAKVFRDRGCDMCHAFGRVVSAPDLAGIMERRDPAWTRKWLKETENMLIADPQAQDMLKQWKGYRMPQIALQDSEIEALFHYFAQETARKRGGSSE